MASTRPLAPEPPARRRPRFALPAGLLAALALGGLGSGRALAALSTGGVALATAAAPALSLDALQTQASQQEDAIKRLEGELQAAQKAQREGERAAAQRAQEIEALKSQPAGVAHDLELQERLAQAQAQAVVLSQQAAALRTREAGLRTAREQLIGACDQILAADTGGKLQVTQRLRWLRLRTAQVEALHGAADRAAGSQAVRTVVQAGAALAPGSAVGSDGDDPQVLRERADLLRDSADKLRREMQRLKARGDELGRRQRLRERAARVDEDLFAEQITSRHVTGTRGTADLAANPSASPQAPAPATQTGGASGGTSFGGANDSGGGGAATSLRAVDPSTLDVLQRVGSLSGPVANQQSLQRAQSELAALTEQLLARAARLEQRAAELARKK
jgi:hypothetical protein